MDFQFGNNFYQNLFKPVKFSCYKNGEFLRDFLLILIHFFKRHQPSFERISALKKAADVEQWLAFLCRV